MQIIPVILSGGSGARLWPLSRKQYLPLVGDNTMLQETILRLNGLDNVNVYNPWIDHAEESKQYRHGIINKPLESDKKYDAVVTVGHNQFKEYTVDDYTQLSNGDSVVIDIKNIVDESTWRL
jgi:UDP-N-acetyl-D-mannosaminuronate dehydrogenase